MAHKVFVSYHHANDQERADYLRDAYGSDNTFLDRSLKEEYLTTNNEELLRLIR